ncbi:hypothetical protein HAX54_046114, partial [Datura stramonium]|nr:hypothetical protein [Datura stramonium]
RKIAKLPNLCYGALDDSYDDSLSEPMTHSLSRGDWDQEGLVLITMSHPTSCGLTLRLVV